MAKYLNVQATAAMFSTISPAGWTVVFGVYVTDGTGNPVTGLKKNQFTVWELTTIGSIDVRLVEEVNLIFPTSSMPGVYRVQTQDVLGFTAPAAQEFLHAIRVGYTRSKIDHEGIATTAVTYLGKPGVIG